MSSYDKLLWETIEWFQRHGLRYRRWGWDISFLGKYIRGVTLDLGSGYASTSRRLLREGYISRLVLVDLAYGVLERIPIDHRIIRIASDIRTYRSIDEYFDTILLVASLHHIPGRGSRLKILENTYRMLKHGGHLIVFTWSRNQLYFLPQIIANIFRRIAGSVESIGDIVIRDKSGLRYYHLYTMRELLKDVVEAGFKIAEKGVYYPRRDGLFKPLKNYYVVALKN